MLNYQRVEKLGKRHQETLCLDVDLPIHLLGDSGSGEMATAEMATARCPTLFAEMERAEQRVKQRCQWEDGDGGREGKNRLKMEVILTKRSQRIRQLTMTSIILKDPIIQYHSFMVWDL